MHVSNEDINLFYFSTKAYVVGIHMNSEMVLLYTQNVCLVFWIVKLMEFFHSKLFLWTKTLENFAYTCTLNLNIQTFTSYIIIPYIFNVGMANSVNLITD